MNWHGFFQRLFHGEGTPLEKVMDLPQRHPIECLTLLFVFGGIGVLLASF